MYVSTSGQVKFINCPFGIDWWVKHTNELIAVVSHDGNEITTALQVYIRAVLTFAEKIKALYKESEPKKFYDEEERRAFEAFNSEWNMRVERASKLLKYKLFSAGLLLNN